MAPMRYAVRRSVGADTLIRAREIHTMSPGVAPQRALAIRGDRVIALSDRPDGLDHLADDQTQRMDILDQTVIPSFDDTHTHLFFASLGVHDVPVHEAKNLSQFLGLIAERAATTPAGRWICTTVNWQELNLEERRMPTAKELDGITDRHPVLVRRGGHNAVLNSAALALAGITKDTQDPPGGVIGRDENGALTGRLIDAALHLAEPVFPSQTREQRIAGLELASANYARSGIGTVRDAALPVSELGLLEKLSSEGRLSTRVRALVMAQGARSSADIEALLDAVEPWRYRADPMVRVWGFKFMLDGGLEGGATEEPYLGHDDYCGLVLWDTDQLTDAVERVVRRGWRVGTHAYGDRAVRLLLDIYEDVLTRHPWLPSNSLVIEHAGLASLEQRARAIALGIPVTIQQPLLHDTAEVELGFWGPERVADIFPARQWLDEGGFVTAGSDFPIGQYGAMRSVWGMETRLTVAGLQGGKHAISRQEAFQLHTTRAAELVGEQSLRGSLTPGRLADLTTWSLDPASAPVEALREMNPVLSMLGGRVLEY